MSRSTPCSALRVFFPLSIFVLTLYLNGHPAASKQPYLLKNKFGTILSIDPDKGSYAVELRTTHAAGAAMAPGKEQPWLGSGIVSVYSNRRWFRSAAGGPNQAGGNNKVDGRLVLVGSQTGSATDSLGNYDFVELSWAVPGEGIPIITAFHLYQDKPYLVFVQHFPKGFKNYANGDWTVPSVAFPQFISSNWGIPQNLYSWRSGGMWDHRLGYGDAFSIQGTVDPLVLSDQGYRTVILSSFANYLVGTQQSKPLALEDTLSSGSITCGIEGLVQDIPAGFEHQHIMVVGLGIHSTFQEWGSALLKKAGKKSPSKYLVCICRHCLRQE